VDSIPCLDSIHAIKRQDWEAEVHSRETLSYWRQVLSPADWKKLGHRTSTSSVPSSGASPYPRSNNKEHGTTCLELTRSQALYQAAKIVWEKNTNKLHTFKSHNL
jgi:hypothetical protein